jgi:tetratricopeptide (TPR) repeat protein
MKKILFISVFLFVSLATVMGQKQLQVDSLDLGAAVPREADDNETVVVVKSLLPLDFESTMDKKVDVYDTKEESGFTYYYLKFSTLPKFKGRKLKIKSNTFETHTYPLALTAKVPLGLSVSDPDAEVGGGCYRDHLNQGNRMYREGKYDEAKLVYQDALECSDLPEENELSRKLDDLANCVEYKQTADNFYTAGKWVEAIREYEKMVGLNVADEYAQKRIEQCIETIANIERVITGKVTDQQGNPIEGASIKADFVKKDKNGSIKKDKKGNPEIEFIDVGTSKSDGSYTITVLNGSKSLKFSKGNELTDKRIFVAEAKIVDEEINVSLEEQMTAKDAAIELGKGIEQLGGLFKKK